MAELLARLRAALRRDEGERRPGRAAPGHDRPVAGGPHHPSGDPRRWPGHSAPTGPSPADPGSPPRPGSGGGGPDRAGETLRLTPTEWRILEILLQRPGQLVGSAQILTGVWGPGFGQRTNYLRFHMARLRRKLEDNPARPRHLLTEPGMGYRYQP